MNSKAAVLCVLLMVCVGQCSIESMTASLINLTPETLYLVSCEEPHGKMTTSAPKTIAPSSVGNWTCQSVMLGDVEGDCTYDIGATGYTMYMSWLCPEIGSNKYTCVATEDSGYDATYMVGGSSLDIVVKFELQKF
ncbi:hypothetical protein Pelo_16428 [Pelomyxa schiedti]|nr:hypothetical protein Pelo_16428 [Pelomyxa schiedti]